MRTGIWLTLTVLLAMPLSQAAYGQSGEQTFKTKPAIYAANEEWLTYACENPEGMEVLGAQHQSEMYWYSLYNFGNLLFRSGMGVHAVNSSLFEKHAKNDKGMPWYNPDKPLMGQRKFMMHKVAQFKARTGVNKLNNMYGGLKPPKGAFPVLLEYTSGDPSFTQAPNLKNFNTLRWEDKEKTLNPGAWGQSLMKAVLWTRDFFKKHRTSGGVTYLGVSAHDGAHGFRGSMLTALSLVKSFEMKSNLAYDPKTDELGSVNPKSYNPKNGPKYYPHRYEPKFVWGPKKWMMNMMTDFDVPPIVRKYKVTDKSSNLFDVASLLWGESEFYYVTDPKVDDAFDKLYGDPKWNPKKMSESKMKQAFRNGKTIFPKGKPHKVAKGMTVVNFKNLKGLHFNKKKGTLVDNWHPESGKGDHISTFYAGMGILALGNTHERLHDVGKVKRGAKKLAKAQAKFLMKQQNADGSIANGFNLGDGVSQDQGDKSLLAQTFAIRGWLKAYEISNNKQFLKAANKAYDYMENELWSEEAGVYKSSEGADQSTYAAMNYGSTIGALREIALTREGRERQAVVDRMDEFFENVKKRNGLQLAEIGQTGDPIPSKEKMKKIKSKIKAMKKDNPERAKKLKQRMKDRDGDNVPKPAFVRGFKHGAAPVTAGEVVINTP